MFHPWILAFTHDPTRMLCALDTQTGRYGTMFSLSLTCSHLHFPEIPLKTLFLGMEMGDESQEVPFLPLED